jgi:hypothetical protein
VPISDDDRAKLEKCFNAFDEAIRDFASRNASSQVSPRLWAAKMRLEEARLHAELHFTQYDKMMNEGRCG